ncbi:MAG: DNA/RNA helicase domain-containing protein [Mycoplasmatales bacterium]
MEDLYHVEQRIINLEEVALAFKQELQKLRTMEANSSMFEHKTISNFEKNVEEFQVIKQFVESMNLSGLQTTNFIHGFKNNDMNYEFDLLKVFKTKIINIELKNYDWQQSPKSHFNYEKITKQLEKHRKLFANSKRKIILISVVISGGKLLIKKYEDQRLKEIQANELYFDLAGVPEPDQLQVLDKILEIDLKQLNFWQNPHELINKTYILSSKQNSAYNTLTTQIKNQKIVAIKGRAGSGKTLIMFKFALEAAANGKTVLIILPFKLSTDHQKLKQVFETKYPNLKIMEKRFVCHEHVFKTKKPKIDWQIFDYVIVDEAQRLSKSEFDEISFFAEKLQIFFDPMQTLQASDLGHKLKQQIIPQIELDQNVRTNPNIVRLLNYLVFGKNDYFSSYNIVLYKLSQTDLSSKQNLNQEICVLIQAISHNEQMTCISEFSPEHRNLFEVIGLDYHHTIIVLKDLIIKEGYVELESELAAKLYAKITRTTKQISIVCTTKEVYDSLSSRFV